MKLPILLATCAVLAGCERAPAPPAVPITASESAGAAASPSVPPSAPVAAPEASSLFPAAFTALGTEPFWSAAVDGNRLVYSTPEDQKGEEITVTRSGAGSVLRLAGELRGGALTLELRAATCSDGMSDTVYPYAVEAQIGTQKLTGCARLAGGQPG